MGADNHLTVRPYSTDVETKARRLASDLDGLDGVADVQVEALSWDEGTYKVDIDLANPSQLTPDVMRVLAEHGHSLGHGCLDSGMNPFRVYIRDD